MRATATRGHEAGVWQRLHEYLLAQLHQTYQLDWSRWDAQFQQRVSLPELTLSTPIHIRVYIHWVLKFSGRDLSDGIEMQRRQARVLIVGVAQGLAILSRSSLIQSDRQAWRPC